MSTDPCAVQRRQFNLALGATLLGGSGSVLADAKPVTGPLTGQTVRLMWIDPLSGLMAPAGANQLKSMQFIAERLGGANNPSGAKFEVIAVDNKLSPTESLNALKSAVDQGIRFVVQGTGSSVAIPLIDAINKNNERNPGQEIVYFNDAAVDPDLTNGKCSFWHFRFDADTTMKLEAMTTYMKDQKDIQKVYILGQNYSHGQQIARYTKEYLKRKRPDIQIVGEDLHPLAQVRDFAPYIAKIKASGADSVVTGNWGSDLQLLVKAAVESGYTAKFFTYYTAAIGTPTALGKNGAGRVYQIAYQHYNMGGAMAGLMKDFKTRFNEDLSTGSLVRIFEFLGAAMAKARSADPVKVAFALEGMKLQSAFGGEVEMRKSDHQLQQTLYMTVWQKADATYPYSLENTGMTLVPVAEYPPYVSSTPTSCQMTRPAA